MAAVSSFISYIAAVSRQIGTIAALRLHWLYGCGSPVGLALSAAFAVSSRFTVGSSTTAAGSSVAQVTSEASNPAAFLVVKSLERAPAEDTKFDCGSELMTSAEPACIFVVLSLACRTASLTASLTVHCL